MITITVSGPQGSGKDVLAKEISAAIGAHASEQPGDIKTFKRRFPYQRQSTLIRIITKQTNEKAVKA